MIIYKYPLVLRTNQTIDMPEGSKILDVQFQDGHLFLWAMVDVSKPLTNYYINIYGTGQSIQMHSPLKHISTVQEGSFVWHVFAVEYRP